MARPVRLGAGEDMAERGVAGSVVQVEAERLTEEDVPVETETAGDYERDDGVDDLDGALR